MFRDNCAYADATICSLFSTAEDSDAAAVETLFSALYSELHRMAQRQIARSGGAVSISPTTLLHKAYIDLAERSGLSFADNARFLGYSARVMRGLIIDHARYRRVHKRGGHFEITALPTEPSERSVNSGELVMIGEALDELAKTDPALAELVDLKFFCGFSFAEIAATRNVSERTVQRNWEKARIYLHRSMRPDLQV